MSWRVVLLSGGLMYLVGRWIQQAALLTLSAQVSMAAPPVPALLALVLLMGYHALGKRLPKPLRLSLQEALLIYAILTLAVAMCSGGALRLFIPELTVLPYFATPDNGYQDLANAIPDWYIVKDVAANLDYFEGSESGAVPWRAWAAPLGAWSGFFLLFFGAMMGMSLLVSKPWMDDERLRFPISELPLEMVGRGPMSRGKTVFGSYIFWIGFGVVGLYNLLNILKSFNPSVPALPIETPLHQFFTEGPLRNIWWLSFAVRPQVFGFGYLMPTDVLLSCWVLCGWLLVQHVVFFMVGYQQPGVPFENEQITGAYLVLACVILYGSRRHIGGAARALVRREKGAPIPIESKGLIAAVLCIVGIFVLKRWAGMGMGTIAVYYGMTFLFGVVATRVRAEAGLPSQWICPIDSSNNMPKMLWGSDYLLKHGGLSNLSTLVTNYFMGRGVMPGYGSFQMEALQIGRHGGIKMSTVTWGMMFAVILGLGFGYWMHLDAAYEYGANVLEGGTSEGGYRIELCRRQYDAATASITSPVSPEPVKVVATLAGGVQVAILVLLRRVFLRFPLHPLGFALGFLFGRQNWSMLFLVWLCKVLILKFGGMRSYHKLLPFFLGVAFGHFVVAGMLWGSFSAFGGEAFRGYVVWF